MKWYNWIGILMFLVPALSFASWAIYVSHALVPAAIGLFTAAYVFFAIYIFLK